MNRHGNQNELIKREYLSRFLYASITNKSTQEYNVVYCTFHYYFMFVIYFVVKIDATGSNHVSCKSTSYFQNTMTLIADFK